MTGIWVDTDLGFDDLWALLLLRHLKRPVEGVSLVAGNAPLPQVAANAVGAKQAYGFDWPMWKGADRPLERAPETAARILGATGMRTRGRSLPVHDPNSISDGALDALHDWLAADQSGDREILALGPLTNLALLLQQAPDIRHRIRRFVWMGGSAGAGNHTPYAEFNAVADAEAADKVLASGIMIDVVDLTFCRQFLFTEHDMPTTTPLTRDLLGGYLDIALERGRTGMAIYDPLAALALAQPAAIEWIPCNIDVSTAADQTYGSTRMSQAEASHPIRRATRARADLSQICLSALTKEALDGPRK